jgi:hypothetical protein
MFYNIVEQFLHNAIIISVIVVQPVFQPMKSLNRSSTICDINIAIIQQGLLQTQFNQGPASYYGQMAHFHLWNQSNCSKAL